MALTATADALTRADIVERLQLQDARQFVSSFDRPNIRYTHRREEGRRRAQLLRFIEREHEGDAGIVYCQSRKRVEEVAQMAVPSTASTRCPTTPGWTPACASATRTASCATTAS